MKKQLSKFLCLGVAAFGGLIQNAKAQVTTLTFSYTGAQQTFTIPSCTSPLTITCKGAQGAQGAVSGTGSQGGAGGLGGLASGVLTPTVGAVLNIFVGGQGTVVAGGFNGGGNGGNLAGGGGGGASDIRLGGIALANRIITAGGGGGGGAGGCTTATVSGGGGGLGGNGNGGNGTTSASGGGGFGALAAAGGSAGIGCAGFLGTVGIAGTTGTGGAGGDGQTCCCSGTPSGGGGGGGDVGGGGGGGGSAGTVGCSGNEKGGGGGGAGGTSVVSGSLTSPTTSAGVNSGNGVITISYAPGLIVNITPATPSVCVGSAVTMTASGATNYSWSTGAITSTVSVSPSVTTVYTLSAITGTCFSTNTISVNAYSVPVVSVSGPTNAVCSGSQAVLSASGAASYSWSSGAVTSTAAVTPTANTVYTVVGTNSLGCSAAQTIAVMSSAPNLSIATSASVLCSGSSATLTASGANSYTWSTTSTSAAIVVSPTINTTYTVIGTNSLGCTASMVITQTVASCTGIQTVNKDAGVIRFYPNPTKGIFSIDYDQATAGSRIEIRDIQGKLIKSVMDVKEVNLINISEQPAGIYVVKLLESNKEIFTTRIIKE